MDAPPSPIGMPMNGPLRLANLYYLLALAGLVVTGYFNGRYLLEGGGLGPGEFFGAAMANSLTTAITIDVYLAALVFAVWVVIDSKRTALKRPWLYILLCFFVGLAVAFPLYLARREGRQGIDATGA